NLPMRQIIAPIAAQFLPLSRNLAFERADFDAELFGGRFPLPVEVDDAELRESGNLRLVVCRGRFRRRGLCGLRAPLDRFDADPTGKVIEIGIALSPIDAEVWNSDEPTARSRCGRGLVETDTVLVVVGAKHNFSVGVLPAHDLGDGAQIAGVECDDRGAACRGMNGRSGSKSLCDADPAWFALDAVEEPGDSAALQKCFRAVRMDELHILNRVVRVEQWHNHAAVK